MWSGPRNISTAMMRAWGNRDDTFVVDEPFYAFYLKKTGADHPGAEEVIAAGETDWRKIVANLTGPIPNGRRIFYQKQMTHHLLPEVSRDWLRQVTNCFLIRDPAEVIASYIKKNREPTVPKTSVLCNRLKSSILCASQTGFIPPVIDADDVLRDPGANVASIVRCDRCRILQCDVVMGARPRARRMESGQSIGMPK